MAVTTRATDAIKTGTRPLAKVIAKPQPAVDREEGVAVSRPPRRPDYPLMAALLDSLMLIVAGLLISTTMTVNVYTSGLLSATQLGVFTLVSVIWLVALASFSLYRIEASYQIGREMFKLVLAVVFADIVAMGLLYIGQVEVTRAALMNHTLLALALFLGWRGLVFMTEYVSYVSTLKLPRKVMVIGSNGRAAEMAKVLKGLPQQKVDLVGVMASSGDKIEAPVLGDLSDDAVELIQRHKISDVIITLPRQLDDLQLLLLETLREQAVELWVVPSYMNLSVYSQKAENLDDLAMVNVTTPHINPVDKFLKRMFDISVALVLLLLAGPVMLMVALAIRFTDPGPILFVQERVGLNGKNFRIFKFRSMYVDADKRLEEVAERDEHGRITNHKRKNDPRVTPIGRIIRKTSLDELPQILNVLRGDMSLVGPRPELPKLVDEYEPWQRHRFMMPQGITGWWQVNGRSENPCHMSTDQDVYYINNFSFLMDIQIMLMTLPALLRGKGAF